MTFNIPKPIDEFFVCVFMLFFLIGFMCNVYSNGQATLLFIHSYYDMKPNNSSSISIKILNTTIESNKEFKAIQDFTNKTYFNNNFVNYLALIFYWLISPLICFYFAIFRFNKNMWLDN
jgi:hypothetical protein